MDERVATLEATPGWSWDLTADAWQEGRAHLRAYVEREGHARVPTVHIADDGYRLGTWVSRQRADCRRGQLTAVRIAELEAVPGWSWDPIADAWHEGLAHLLVYVEREGNGRVPKGHVTDDGYPLGAWVSTRRADRRKGQLTAVRIAELEAVPGWSWDPIADAWQEGLAYVGAFVERQGHARVPSDYVTHDGYPLGAWVSTQRRTYLSGRLTAVRIAELEAVPGWSWDPIADAWQEGLAHLQVYVDREGHARVPNRYVSDDGYPLGSWVSTRRADRRKGQLTLDRTAALQALPGWSWSIRYDENLGRRPGQSRSRRL
jgi:hypothetical protein